MTELSHHAGLPVRIRRTSLPFARFGGWRRVAPLVCLFAGGAVGVVAGRALAVDATRYEPNLLLLLRFMALVKGLGVLLAAGVAVWRFARPIATSTAGLFCAAIAAMAVAPGLIWSLGGMVLGALAFHAGLLGFLALAWSDRRS